MMDRRSFLAAGAGTLLFAGGGAGAVYALNNDRESETDSEQPTTITDPPAAVAESESLGKAFYNRISEYYTDVSVYIRRNGELVMEYASESDGSDELRTEFNAIASEYAKVVKSGDYQPKTLSIVVGEVQALVTEPAVRAYSNGDINRDSLLETIQVMSIERTD